MTSGAFKSTAAAAAVQDAGRCIPVLAYIARKRSELQKAQAIKHCRFVGQNYDQSTGHDISCLQALPLKQYPGCCCKVAPLCISAASLGCRCQAL